MGYSTDTNILKVELVKARVPLVTKNTDFGYG